MRLILAACLGLAMTAGPALAQAAPEAPAAVDAVPADVQALFDGLGLPEVIGVMALEGIDYGDTLAESIFAGRPAPAAWADRIAAIYDVDEMRADVLAAFAGALDDADTGAMLAFFEAEPGRTLASLEASAREAMLDDEVEAAAKEAAAVALAGDNPRVALIQRYAEANDLIETNVAGALNSNYSYFMGMMDGGAGGGDLTPDDVLADVQAQEPQIRADTVEWLTSFLLLAYGPASDEDLEALIAFSETEPGRDLNRALFDAFDGVFDANSRQLGLASALYLTTEEL